MYLIGYATLRYSNVLVRKQILNHKGFGGFFITKIWANHDRSRTEVAFFKNRAADISEAAYTPLRQMEEVFWNWGGK